MPLIDPTSPEGFFHSRIIPYKMKLLETGRSLFPTHPDEDAESYFEPPLTSDPNDRIMVHDECMTARAIVKALRERWENEDEDVLLEMSELLEEVRQQVVNQKPEVKTEISDFVYPLF